LLQGAARALFAVVAVSAAFAPGLAGAARTGAASGFYEARVLEPAASYVARKPITVWCAPTTAVWQSWSAEATLVDGANGSAAVGGSDIHLSHDVCPSLRGAIAGVPQYVPTLSATIEVLTHESIHARGTRDEGITDCDSMHEMPRVAVVFFHVRPGAQLRALMAAAWTYHREAPPQYQSVC
jgi:hypothetical protein